jgi:NAD(P) transhydrogenase subunit beta
VSGAASLQWLAQASYFVAATLFLLGLQRMASPKTARSGIQWAGAGMVLATIATLLLPGLHNLGLIVLATVLGTMVAWVWGKRVAITDMPQMVALFNGMGGGSAAAIGAVEMLRYAQAGVAPPRVVLVLGVVGALIGAVSLSGSVVAWAKHDGRMDKRYTFPGQQWFNALVALALGVFMSLPIGGSDMTVVISLYNALTGLAVAF